jgi:hypothetical protein
MLYVRQVPGFRKPLDEGGTQYMAYSRQWRAWECQFSLFRAREEAWHARVPGLSELQKAWSTQVPCPSSLMAFLVMANCALG